MRMSCGLFPGLAIVNSRAKRRLLRVFLSLSFFWGVESTFAFGQELAAESPLGSAKEFPQSQVQPGQSVSLRMLPRNILEDEKDVFLFPKDLTKGKHWWPTIGVLGVTAGLLASDPYTAPPFRTTTRFKTFNQDFSGINTGVFMAAVPTALYGVGWLRKSSYSKETALLAGEAVADGFLLDIAFKGITGRKQPLSYTGTGPYADSFFSGSHNPFHSGGFYSVHANAATAVATVLARRYGKHRWVPFVAYGLAGAISFSRITRSDHFPGDVFVGGAIGFVISNYVVLPHRN